MKILNGLLMIWLIPPMISGVSYKSCAPEKHCVPYELCSEGYGLDGHFYPELNRTLLDHLHCQYMEKCCHLKDTLSICRTYNGSLLQQGKCGSRLDLWFHMHRLTSTQQEVKFGEFPWLVAIYDKSAYLCSGALITPVAVLTAANCVHGKRKSELHLVAGEWEAAVEWDPLPEQTRTVDKLLVHPSYRQSMSHNLALLLVSVEKPFELTAHVHVICLPSPEIIHNLRDCYVAGWGPVDDAKNLTSLKRSSVFVLPRDQCASKLRMAIFGQHLNLNDTLLCAGGGKDNFVCNDQGAIPLMCLLSGSSNRFALVGLLARATHCDSPQLLGIYTNVLLYRSWIDLQLEEHDADTDRYMID